MHASSALRNLIWSAMGPAKTLILLGLFLINGCSEDLRPKEGEIFRLPLDSVHTMVFIWMLQCHIWLGKTEVTIDEFVTQRSYSDHSYLRRFTDYTGAWPVVNISAEQAVKYCALLNKRFHLPSPYVFRLPSVAEWETAAAIGYDGKAEYPWGNSWPPGKMTDGILPNYWGMDARISNEIDFADYPTAGAIPDYYDKHVKIAPVERSGKNPLGFMGMAGNVGEWCLAQNHAYALKGGDYQTSAKVQLGIRYDRILPERPSTFLPFIADKRSNWATGFRIAIGKDK